MRREHGLTVLFLAGERPYVIERSSRDRARGARRWSSGDGLDRALICLSSPLGIESLPREQAQRADRRLPRRRARARRAVRRVGRDRARPRRSAPTSIARCDRGCVGISLPAGALAERRRPRAAATPCCAGCERAGAPLLIHPGPGLHAAPGAPRGDRRAVAVGPAVVVGADALRRRTCTPRGWRSSAPGAPSTRGCASSSRCSPALRRCTPSGCARAAGRPRWRRPADLLRDLLLRPRRPCAALAEIVGAEQLLYGSDRPVVDPAEHGMLDALDWDAVGDATRRALRRPRALARARADVPRAHRAAARVRGRRARWHGERRAGRRRAAHAAAAARCPRCRARAGATCRASELEAFVRELADRPELWIDFVRHDASQRVYEELLSDAHVTAWLICWMDDQDTGLSRPRRLRRRRGGRQRRRARGAPGDRRRADRSRARVRRRRGLSLLAASDIHRVRHGGSDPAVTLHVYSPPLARMGAYAIGDDGVLARRTMPSSQELRPQDAGSTSDGRARRAPSRRAL